MAFVAVAVAKGVPLWVGLVALAVAWVVEAVLSDNLL